MTLLDESDGRAIWLVLTNDHLKLQKAKCWENSEWELAAEREEKVFCPVAFGTATTERVPQTHHRFIEKVWKLSSNQ